MRVLHVLNDARDVGNGINNVTVDLACAQAALGHDVAVASAPGEFTAFLAQRGVAHLEVGDRPRDARSAWALVRGLHAAAATWRPDVVHTHNLVGTLAVALTGATLHAGRRRHRPATAATVHLEVKRGVGLVWLADRVLFFSEAARAGLRRGVPGRWLPAGRSLVVLQGPLGGARATARAAATPAGAPGGEHHLPGPPRVVTVCGLYRHKGVFDLVEAFALLARTGSPAVLDVVGGGPEREALEAAVVAAGLADRVRLHGFVADPRPIMAAADLFVLASRSDPAPLVLAEVRAAGTAIVSTDLPGCRTLLEDGAAARLVPPADPAALAAAIGDLLADEPERARLAARGSAGLEALGMDRYAADVLAVYVDLVAARRC